MFQHIPYFLQTADEPVNYFNIPQPARRRYLDLLEKSGVDYVFAGHYHRNAIGSDGPLTEVVTGAVGKPLGQSVSGFRIVRVKGKTLESTRYCLGGIPNQIDPANALPETCSQNGATDAVLLGGRFLSPKNAGSDQRTLVMRRAISERLQ